ncbi:MAG: GNAT family N-acetyltransferase [Nostocaceae cyanobacterium]|nr:GNAT family N-acetyltransferase [Nostocaceae cyanobacterium]
MHSQVLDINNPLWKETLQNIRHDIYQLPEYLSLEAKRHNKHPEAILISDGDKIFFCPYLISKCQDIGISQDLIGEEILEIKSPYGYPGILLSETATNTPGFADIAMNEFQCILREKNVCSAFLRMHPILNENLNHIFQQDIFTENGETISVDLRISGAEIWSNTKGNIRNKINKCKKNGFTVRMVDFDKYIDEYVDIYQETMERVTAKNNYFDFNKEYCLQLKSALGEQLHLCLVEVENEVASAGLYTESGGIVQSLFGGTKNKFVKMSPSTLETDYARLWAKERGNEFMHLGGGLGASKDSLYKFKASFSKLSHTFSTLRLVLDDKKYSYLLRLRAEYLNTTVEKLLNSNFFPAYNASSKSIQSLEESEAVSTKILAHK